MRRRGHEPEGVERGGGDQPDGDLADVQVSCRGMFQIIQSNDGREAHRQHMGDHGGVIEPSAAAHCSIGGRRGFEPSGAGQRGLEVPLPGHEGGLQRILARPSADGHWPGVGEDCLEGHQRGVDRKVAFLAFLVRFLAGNLSLTSEA